MLGRVAIHEVSVDIEIPHPPGSYDWCRTDAYENSEAILRTDTPLYQRDLPAGEWGQYDAALDRISIDVGNHEDRWGQTEEAGIEMGTTNVHERLHRHEILEDKEVNFSEYYIENLARDITMELILAIGTNQLVWRPLPQLVGVKDGWWNPE